MQSIISLEILLIFFVGDEMILSDNKNLFLQLVLDSNSYKFILINFIRLIYVNLNLNLIAKISFCCQIK